MVNQHQTPDTRTRLVLAAMQLFWDKGYNSTSIADVLQAAKVNSGSLYYFFPGKADLLAAVLDMYHEGIRPMLLDPAWAGVSDPIERVFALLARYRKSLLDTDCFYGCPIGSLALELHEPDLAVRERLAKNFSAWIDAIAECLSQAKARLPSDINRQELAQFVLTVMEGGVMQARTFRDIAYFDAAVRQLRRYFDLLEGAGGSAPRKPDRTQIKKTREKDNAKIVVGESIYFWDSAAKRLEYLYIESDGGFSRGPVSIDNEDLLFPDTTFVQNGKTMVYRSGWQRSNATAYEVVTEFKSKDAWVPGFKVHMVRDGALKSSGEQ